MSKQFPNSALPFMHFRLLSPAFYSDTTEFLSPAGAEDNSPGRKPGGQGIRGKSPEGATYYSNAVGHNIMQSLIVQTIASQNYIPFALLEADH
jgi:hypothetical protein